MWKKKPSEPNKPNVPFERNDDVSSHESEKNLDREGPRRNETSISHFKGEVREISLAMTNLADQNQLLLDIIMSGKVSSSNVNKRIYMKNNPKSTSWDIKEK